MPIRFNVPLKTRFGPMQQHRTSFFTSSFDRPTFTCSRPFCNLRTYFRLCNFSYRLTNKIRLFQGNKPLRQPQPLYGTQSCTSPDRVAYDTKAVFQPCQVHTLYSIRPHLIFESCSSRSHWSWKIKLTLTSIRVQVLKELRVHCHDKSRTSNFKSRESMAINDTYIKRGKL